MTFLATLATVVAAGQELGARLAGKYVLGRRVMDDLPAPYVLPDRQDWYVAYDEFALDHYILYHGLGESLRYVRAADVLLVGNSQVAYGFPRSMVKQGEQRTGLKFYNLGFGYDEGSKFVLALIEKHDLRPRIVVANAVLVSGDSFFKPQASEFGEKVMASDRWDAWKTVWEWSMSWRVRHSGLEEWLPNWRELRPPGRIWLPRFIYCRSISSGSWGAYREKPRPSLVGTPPMDADVQRVVVPEETLSIARNFKRALAERGVILVLTHVPSPANLHQRQEAMALAAALDVPFVGPVVEGLVTRDGAHFDDASAERFAVRFLDEFIAWLGKSDAGTRPACPK